MEIVNEENNTDVRASVRLNNESNPLLENTNSIPVSHSASPAKSDHAASQDFTTKLFSTHDRKDEKE